MIYYTFLPPPTRCQEDWGECGFSESPQDGIIWVEFLLSYLTTQPPSLLGVCVGNFTSLGLNSICFAEVQHCSTIEM